MNVRVVTVFGGTGFLGRRVVDHLCEHGFFARIASRHVNRGRELFGPDGPQFQSIEVDVHDPASVANALTGAYGAVNAVSLYVERGGDTFHSVHVEAARRLAARARQDGLKRLVHISGIGADASSPSLYIRKRGEGELAVRAVFPDAVVVRPAVMFGPNDAFLTSLLALLRTLPIFPMFGRGLTRLQPVYVGDVAEAIAKAIEQTEKGDRTFECGGPRVYSYEELLRALMRETGLEARLIPMPFAAWHTLARLAEMLPNAPVTRNQIELMQVDNVASRNVPGFAELGISPRSVEDILREMLACPSGGRQPARRRAAADS